MKKKVIGEIMQDSTMFKIKNSEVFLAFITRNFMQDADCLEQSLYASVMKIPIIILLQSDLSLDDVQHLFSNTVVIKVLCFKKNPKEIESQLLKLLKSINAKKISRT